MPVSWLCDYGHGDSNPLEVKDSSDLKQCVAGISIPNTTSASIVEDQEYFGWIPKTKCHIELAPKRFLRMETNLKYAERSLEQGMYPKTEFQYQSIFQYLI
ncbi:hypothetical protein CEXT_646421 [Caerostris extrusa]|uniref:Uncharacterized protein n=1 Tax=Caerostris extrusa TaxID=172846 RepID=A0AAV4M8S0_CAEEX|nr:hypothetical protein CEXT_646421 [Caerostris extrusa]